MIQNEDTLEQNGEDAEMPNITYKPGYNKLDSFNWLSKVEEFDLNKEIVEIRFKNTRKGFYRNVNNLKLEIGDVVAVEASPGHDIGRVSMIGRLAIDQFKDSKCMVPLLEMKKIYRIAKAVDIQKWEEAKKLEEKTMLRSRKIAEDLRLNMKIGDVEYQGDKTKAIFYYIADERVDFRQLIKVLAEEFRIRVEMRQIGARQEAGRIGGIGSCGRELCCSTYITNFISVTTTHAKYQELSLNPQKLAGQCGKLKCCLNFEVDCYVDAQKSFPPREIPLEISDGTLYFQKMEVHKRVYWYSTDSRSNVNMVEVPVERVKEIQAMNRKGMKPAKLFEATQLPSNQSTSADLLEDNSLTRFDPRISNQSRKKHSNKKKRRFNGKKDGQ
jgi:cell fate regulator YaaT (PSP1 superfamily)